MGSAPISLSFRDKVHRVELVMSQVKPEIEIKRIGIAFEACDAPFSERLGQAS
jgi:hypothetical protein